MPIGSGRLSSSFYLSTREIPTCFDIPVLLACGRRDFADVNHRVVFAGYTWISQRSELHPDSPPPHVVLFSEVKIRLFRHRSIQQISLA